MRGLVLVAVMAAGSVAQAAAVVTAPARAQALPADDAAAAEGGAWRAVPVLAAGVAGVGVLGVAAVTTVLAANTARMPNVELARPSIAVPSVTLDPRAWTPQTTMMVLVTGVVVGLFTVAGLAVASKVSCLLFKGMCLGALLGVGFTVFAIHGRELAPCLWNMVFGPSQG